MLFEIYMPCPLCQKEYVAMKYEHWRHQTDGGKLYLDEYAYVHCSGCNNKAHITRMKLTCESGRHHFMVASTTDYAASISTAAHNVKSKAALKWLRRVIEHIED